MARVACPVTLNSIQGPFLRIGQPCVGRDGCGTKFSMTKEGGKENNETQCSGCDALFSAGWPTGSSGSCKAFHNHRRFGMRIQYFRYLDKGPIRRMPMAAPGSESGAACPVPFATGAKALRDGGIPGPGLTGQAL